MLNVTRALALALVSFALTPLTQAGPEAVDTALPPKALPVVASLMTKELPDIAGKEVQMLLVEYPAGGADPVHRHYADAFIYVLEGTIVMQVEGGSRVVLTAGQTFYEGPGDVHVVGENGSRVLPAKFLAVLVKNKGVPPVLPVN